MPETPWDSTSTRTTGIDVECFLGQSRSLNASKNEGFSFPRFLIPVLNDSFVLRRPLVTFHFESSESESDVEIVFGSSYHNVYMIYYPGFLDSADFNSYNGQGKVQCRIVVGSQMMIQNLIPSTVYTFCALIDQLIQTPFQCKSYQTPTPFKRQTWIYQEQKAIILTTFLMLVFLSLIVGVVMTYLLIRRIPTLMKGSKRVVMVNNRTKEVMVMPGGSRSNSWQRETTTPIKTEAPTYLTPLPRQSFDNK